MNADTPVNELYHHGVKGMKWGIRRYQPYPKGTHGKFLNQDRDDDIRIKAGTVAFRVQSTSDLKGSGQTYVSFTPNDHLKYLAATADGEGGVAIDVTMDNGNGGKPYSMKMKLSKDIIAPSYEKTMDAFIDTIDKMGGAKKFARDMTGSMHEHHKKQEVKAFLKKYGHRTVDEARDEAYITFAKHFMKDTTARNLFFANLKAQGYNAIVDDWDKRFDTENKFTETPMIIFDKSQTLRKTGTKAVTDKDNRFLSEYSYDEEFARQYFGDRVKEWDKWMKD